MIRWLRQHFAPVLYVQIWERRLKITECATGKVYDDVPLMALQTLASGKQHILAIGKEAAGLADANVVTINPFSHPRTLLADFYVAEKILQHAFSTFARSRFLRVRPKTILQPMEKAEGGLNAIECRAFRELAMGAGAIAVTLYLGPPLAIHSIEFDQIKDVDTGHALGATPPTQDVGWVGLLLMLGLGLCWWYLKT